jgi:hypothetical protein
MTFSKKTLSITMLSTMGLISTLSISAPSMMGSDAPFGINDTQYSWLDYET